jgi:hypothetical protein
LDQPTEYVENLSEVEPRVFWAWNAENLGNCTGFLLYQPVRILWKLLNLKVALFSLDFSAWEA